MEARKETEPIGSTILRPNLCRVCRCSCNLEESTCINLFDDNAGAVRHQFDSCGFFSSKVSSRDGLPTLVCMECIQRLETSWKFQVMCVESERIFREIPTRSKDIQNTKDRVTEPDKSPLDVNLLGENYREPAIDKSVVHITPHCVDPLPDRLWSTVSDLGCEAHLDPDKKEAAEGQGKDTKISGDPITEPDQFPPDVNPLEEDNQETLIPSVDKSVNVDLPLVNFRSNVSDVRVERFEKCPAPDIEETAQKRKSHACNICVFIAKNAGALRLHMKVHKDAVECADDKSYICEICGKSFLIKNSLQIHREIHFPNEVTKKRFSCTECDYSTRYEGEMKIHSRCHTGERPIECTICHFKFKTLSNLHRHVRNLHNREKLFNCKICDKSFFNNTSLQNHVVSHTKQQRYKCSICKAGYVWHGAFRLHMLKMHRGVRVPTQKECREMDG